MSARAASPGGPAGEGDDGVVVHLGRPPGEPRPAPAKRGAWVRVLVALVAVVGLSAAVAVPRYRSVLLDDRFDRPDGLITNEYAHWNPIDGSALRSDEWDLTSGSLFASGGAGWSGRPDHRTPDPRSRASTNSGVFRMISQQDGFGDVRVSLELSVDDFDATAERNDWDGVHLFLRYQSAHELYSVSVARRDGAVVVKKKAPQGDAPTGSGEDAYRTLASVPYGAAPPGWHHIEVRVRTRDAHVDIEAEMDGALVIKAQDRGVGGPPILAPGRVGIRADNTEFHVDDVVVARI